MPARDVAEDGVVGDRDQLQRVPPLEAQRVERGAPCQPVEALGQAIGERQPFVAAETDQATTFVDPVGCGVGHGISGVVHPRNAAMFVA
jgi:hypothetical protein